ncbi:MAG TPA: PQQ-dependent sugar dehydrogenase [Steroidobacteraceae bacterium]|nr:PQQ-dependent sugar dehydrogenase [Steroidobacteraceae bacterium]
MKQSTPIAQSLFLLALLAGTGACQESGHVPPSGDTKVTVTPVATGLQHPWGLAFLPDGRMLVTERPGRLRVVSADGSLSEPVAGVPAVHAVNQGGLLDVALDPGFASNSTIYLSYAERGEGDENGTAVARARLDGLQLRDVAVIYRQQPKFASGHHFGSRLVFAKDGTLFVTQGDRNKLREAVQDLSTHIGKVVRIDTDGGVPADNPFVGRDGARPEIWSYGHRNIQGAALHPETGELWTHEHGPKGGDEINVTRAGKNYGWPVITYGREYFGPAIGEGTAKAGMEQPLHYWVPSIAPSGMAFHDGRGHPQWRGQLFVGALAARQLVRLELKDDGTVRTEERIEIGERVRDVRVGPDGALYLLTDEDPGRLLRVVPAD